MVMKLMNTLTLSIQTQFMGEYDDSLIGPLDDEGEVPSTVASDQWLLEYAIQDFEKHHKDKLKQYVENWNHNVKCLYEYTIVACY